MAVLNQLMRRPKLWRVGILTGTALVIVMSVLLPRTRSARFEIRQACVQKLHSIHEFTDTGIRDTSDPWIASVQLREPAGASPKLIFDFEDDQWVQVRAEGRWLAPQHLASISDVNTYGLYNYGPIYIPVPEGAQAVRLILKWRYRDPMERASARISSWVDKPNSRSLCMWVHRWLLWPLGRARERGILPLPRFRQSIIEIPLSPHQEVFAPAPGQTHNDGPRVDAVITGSEQSIVLTPL
jgi:hypothetical protein